MHTKQFVTQAVHLDDQTGQRLEPSEATQTQGRASCTPVTVFPAAIICKCASGQYKPPLVP